MKDYSKMSDFEINKAIASSLGFKYIGRTWIDGADGIYHAVEKNDRRTDLPNYCNNPSDAWPIMDERKIGLAFVNGEWRASSVKAGYHEFSDTKAFRAAMIVYLMMKEAEKCWS